MDYKDAIAIFENNTKRSVVQIERCSVGIANYVFIVSTANEKFVLRCSKDENAYKDTVYWLNRLSVCEIPIPIVLSEGKYKDYSYLILSYIRGDDIGNVYCKLSDSEKKQIAKEVVKIQRKVSRLDIHADMEWTWNCFVDKMLNRAEKRIKRKNYFDFNKIYIIKKLQQEIQEYLDKVPIAPYLDDISTKNLLIYEGNVSGIIDIDWIGFGDMLTFVALTRVSLLNMDLDTKYKDAIAIFENNTKRSVVQIERCSVGIANYVFIVSTANEKFVLRCSKDENAYKDTVYWLNRLSVCEIPIPIVLSEGKYKDYSYLILSYIRGDDIGNVYCKLSDSEKKQIAKEVVKIQRKVSRLDIHADMEWTWNCFVDKMLNRAEKRIKRKNYFDFNKIYIIKKLQQEIQEYLDKVPIAPYLDDISTKNLLIYEGNVSGIIDIDWIGFGDMLTFVALTRVSLLNMDLDTKYIDYLLDEIRPNTIEYKAFIFYCLIYCVDFMGEIGMQFLDKTIPVNENIIERLNDIFDFLMEEWDKYCKR